ncbi:Hypothetical protein GLP15_523 [Giardia lamblia P15]|uniref:Uncharacterized protein n=1 Tax=Giardia intestinalis (strain P15) TaxID=658858 RepID=E1F6F4_GIAIA|nr:Hypothetical protein GLP15_523 [Giardia lamblia P15]
MDTNLHILPQVQLNEPGDSFILSATEQSTGADSRSGLQIEKEQLDPVSLCDVSATMEKIAKLYEPASNLPKPENYNPVHGCLTPEDLDASKSRTRHRRKHTEEYQSSSRKRPRSQSLKYISPYNQRVQTRVSGDIRLRRRLEEQEDTLHRTSRTLREYLDQREKEEMAECTFKPDLAPSRALFRARCDQDPHFRLKFHERNDRMVAQRTTSPHLHSSSPQMIRYDNHNCNFINDGSALDAYLQPNRLRVIKETTRQKLDLPRVLREEQVRARRAQTAQAVERSLSQKTREYLNSNVVDRLHVSTPLYMQTRIYREHQKAMERLEKIHGPHIQREIAFRTGSRPYSAPGWNIARVLTAQPTYTRTVCDDFVTTVHKPIQTSSVGEDSSFSTRLSHMSSLYRARMRLSKRASGTQSPPLRISALDLPTPNSVLLQVALRREAKKHKQQPATKPYVIYSNAVSVPSYAAESSLTPELFQEDKQKDLALTDILVQSTDVGSGEAPCTPKRIRYQGPILHGDLSPPTRPYRT